MSDALNDVSRRTLTAGDRYLALLAIVLLGYALMGKGFAYIGFPPLYVGEIAFLTGIAVFVRSGVLVASLATLPSLVLAATMMWVLARTVPFVSVYGFDALRDSVIILYGGFAFVVIGLLLEDARRIDTVLRYYSNVLVVFPAIPWGSGSPNIGQTISRNCTVRTCRSWRSQGAPSERIWREPRFLSWSATGRFRFCGLWYGLAR